VTTAGDKDLRLLVQTESPERLVKLRHQKQLLLQRRSRFLMLNPRRLLQSLRNIRRDSIGRGEADGVGSKKSTE